MKEKNLNKRRKYITIFVVLLLFSLTGCTAIKNKLEDNIKKESGVLEDQDYIEYIDWEEEPDFVKHEGSIFVSFANNNNLDIEYYYDQELSNLVDINNCYINPGDTIYSRVATNNSNKLLYSFNKFEIYDVKDGKRTVVNNVSVNPLEVSISKDYNGDSLSVVPMGSFNNREIFFSDYYLLADGTKKELDCQWFVNDDKKFDSVSLNPLDEYSISCDYSGYSDKFYISNSYPDIIPSTINDVVVFENAYSIENKIEYSLEMHQYISIGIDDDMAFGQPIKSISIDGEEIELTSKIEKLRVGQLIKIRVDSSYIVNSPNLEILNKNSFDNFNEYTIRIPDTTANELVLSILKSSNPDNNFTLPKINNGVVTLTKENGESIIDGSEVGDNENVIMKITPNNGYYLSSNDLDNGVYSKKMTFKKYLSSVNSIISKQPIKKMITVYLDVKDENGICKYTLDGVEVSGSTLLKENQKLMLEYSLTSSEYKISRKWYDAYHLVFDRNKVDIEIEINDSLDNQTIKACDYVKLEAKRWKRKETIKL